MLILIYVQFLSIRSVSRLSSSTRSHTTYICKETLEPAWVGQRFLFEVPEKASEDTRNVAIRVSVSTKSIVQLPKTLGKTDIHFSCLKDEEPVVGWFPLRPPTSSTVRSNYNSFGLMGSVKLKLQWVHTNAKLIKYTIRATKK